MAQDFNRRDNRREDSEFNETVVSIDRVSRVVKGGRRFRFRTLVVVGDGNGKVGVGVSKGQDVALSVNKATQAAKKNMVEISKNNTTIPHETSFKHAGSKVMLRPSKPGTGIIAGLTVRNVVEAAGITDVVAKTYGSTNKINVAYATIGALKTLKSWEDRK